MTTLEDTARIARRVFGGAHPLAVQIERELRRARAALRAREDDDDDSDGWETVSSEDFA